MSLTFSPHTLAFKLRDYWRTERNRFAATMAFSKPDLERIDTARALTLRVLRNHCRRPHQARHQITDPVERLRSWIGPSMRLACWNGLFVRSRRSIGVETRLHRASDPCLGACGGAKEMAFQVFATEHAENDLIILLHELAHFGFMDHSIQHQWLHTLALLQAMAVGDRIPGNPLALSEEDEALVWEDFRKTEVLAW